MEKNIKMINLQNISQKVPVVKIKKSRNINKVVTYNNVMIKESSKKPKMLDKRSKSIQ